MCEYNGPEDEERRPSTHAESAEHGLYLVSQASSAYHAEQHIQIAQVHALLAIAEALRAR